MAQVAEPFIPQGHAPLEKGRVVIFARQAIRIFRRIPPPLRAMEIKAHVILRRRVDGIYDADPERCPTQKCLNV